MNRHGLTVAREPRVALRIDLDAVGLRIRNLQRDKLDVAALRIEPPDHVAVLQREPGDALLVEHQRVRVLRIRIGHLEDRSLLGLRIDIADRAVLVARVPGVALGVDLDGVRQGVVRQRKLFHIAGRRIEAAHHIAKLPDPPDAAVLSLHRIARALAELRVHPFLPGDLHGAGHQRGRAARVRREMLRKVGGELVAHVFVGRHVDHCADQLFPAVLRVTHAVGDHVVTVTRHANAIDQELALALRHGGLLALRLRGKRSERDKRGGDQRGVERLWHSRPPKSEFRILAGRIAAAAMLARIVAARNGPRYGRTALPGENCNLAKTIRMTNSLRIPQQVRGDRALDQYVGAAGIRRDAPLRRDQSLLAHHHSRRPGAQRRGLRQADGQYPRHHDGRGRLGHELRAPTIWSWACRRRRSGTAWKARSSCRSGSSSAPASRWRWDRTPARRRSKVYGDVKRISVITPYMPVGDKQVVKFFTDCGYEVVASRGCAARARC